MSDEKMYRRWREQPIATLEPFYLRHVSAMTSEELDAKSDIAAELAFKDTEIADLRAALGRANAIIGQQADEAKRLSDQIEPPPELTHDPIENAEKLYSLEAWISVARAELYRYLQEWRGKNEFHLGEHTWSEWHNSFIRYMSW